MILEFNQILIVIVVLNSVHKYISLQAPYPAILIASIYP